MFRYTFIEIYRLFHKKSILVIWGLMFLFCIVNNVLYFTTYDDDGYYIEKINNNDDKKKLERELSSYDINKDSDVSMYLSLKSKIDMINLKKEFNNNSWEYYYIDKYFYDYFYDRNYDVLIDGKEVKDDEMMLKLRNHDWEYFIDMELDEYNDKARDMVSKRENISDVLEKNNIDYDLSLIKENIKLLEYRKKYNVKEEKSYLNQNILDYLKKFQVVSSYRYGIMRDKDVYYKSLSSMKVCEYILENRLNINKENSVNYMLRTISSDYEIFLVILIFVICSISICEEFQKGTIKLVLIKPYSRGKILLSKYFASIIMFVISVLVLTVLQLGVGIYLFGLDSLRMPVVFYDGGICKYSIWIYMLIRFVSRMPFFMLLFGIGYLVGVLFTNTVISIVVPFMFYLFDSFVRDLGIKYHLGIIKYSIQANWHIEKFMFGGRDFYPGTDIYFSLVICFIYFIVLYFVTLYCFKKKDIKNV